MDTPRPNILLLVEDDPQEREIAKKVIADRGYKAAVAANLDDASRIMEELKGKLAGVVTDLHFPERYDLPDATKPCGLAVVAEAVLHGLPIAVCSNVDHHFARYAKVVVEVLAQSHPTKSIPFVMDSKDWGRAVSSICEQR